MQVKRKINSQKQQNRNNISRYNLTKCKLCTHFEWNILAGGKRPWHLRHSIRHHILYPIPHFCIFPHDHFNVKYPSIWHLHVNMDLMISVNEWINIIIINLVQYFTSIKGTYYCVVSIVLKRLPNEHSHDLMCDDSLTEYSLYQCSAHHPCEWDLSLVQMDYNGNILYILKKIDITWIIVYVILSIIVKEVPIISRVVATYNMQKY